MDAVVLPVPRRRRISPDTMIRDLAALEVDALAPIVLPRIVQKCDEKSTGLRVIDG
ncbi:MAG TPA: hypothetical protein VFV80_14120 [Geminicoccaceae bacterium]|nr:hypothetical protein [Geminicoccaceae bacterium]